MLPATRSFWGKAQPDLPAGPSMHPVVAHSLDVAAVAVLLHRGRLNGQTVGFLVALHDIGKFSRPFQGMVPSHWPTASLGPWPAHGVPPGPKHDALGYHMLQAPLEASLDRVLPRRVDARRAWTSGERAPLLRGLAGHHGRPPAVLDFEPTSNVLCRDCLEAAADFIAAMERVFAPPPLPGPLAAHEMARLGWQLAGLTTLADWIGSRQAWFPYVTPEAVADPADYLWSHALPRAASALAAAGLAAARPSVFAGVRSLFPRIETPSPIQSWAETVPLPEGPVLAVIEDLTGSGKTEAAMTLAHRLLSEGRASGLFVALPTMATANAMFARLADAYHGLFVAEARPSLALAHGRADLDPRFAAAIPGGPVRETRLGTDPADEPAEAHCAAWLAEDRRRALLAQVGVGTLDQALLAVLPVRHAALRLQGLAGKLLIIDEVHAFDAYMRREILTLLEFHAALGGSVVLLSATLPHKLREALVQAFRRGLAVGSASLVNQAYPLATLVGAQTVREDASAPRAGLPRRVTVTRLPDAEAAMARILAAEMAGAAVAWIRNTVDDAITAAEALRAEGVEVLLFHARFAMVDRLEIEREVLRRFGRDGKADGRQGVLVATQVIEQSLDLDFDVLVTDLAPADLLIQRAGRLWRHERDARPVPGPELLVVSPEPVAAPAADWITASQPGTAAVYRDPALLWRSARAVFGRGAIATPEDMRPLIEEAFDDASEGAVPPALALEASRAMGKDQAATGVARQNLLAFSPCYDAGNGAWEPETKTPTRLEDRPQVTLRLARLKDGEVVPYAEDPDRRRAWALSEVSVARFRIAACPVPEGLEAAAEAARATWGRWERESERLLLAVMADDFTLAGINDARGTITVKYDAYSGIIFNYYVK